MDVTYYSLEALAAALALPKGWLKHEADAGRIPCLRVNSRRMFDLQAVRDALAERAIQNRTEKESPHASECATQ
ncbi:MAG: hypothetical protein O7D91_01990 [Planctomycetota bacterium]|nr:hypothetical protein [Planctomycetota bacterium]